jgi:hypothetical protein
MTLQKHRSRHAVIALALGLIIPTVQAQSTPEAGGTATYRNERFGFSFSYPAQLFSPDPQLESEAGTALATADGRVRLLASAGPNATEGDLDSYRKFVLSETYAGAKITYAPVRSNWFVVAGEKDGRVFYERITFACSGTRIYGWQMTYPIADRAKFDPIVESIHKSYRPRSGDEGVCK